MSPSNLEIYDKVISFVKMHGPALPAEVAKHINTNILLASALLSDMVSKNQLLISHAKIGSSPVYYLKGQEQMLEHKLYAWLNEKDKQTYDFLKQHMVLEDSKLDPLTRVSLRNLRDFAIPMVFADSTASGIEKEKTEQVFWRWHLFPESKANQIVGQILRASKISLKMSSKARGLARAEKPLEPAVESDVEKKKGTLSKFIEERMIEKGIKPVPAKQILMEKPEATSPTPKALKGVMAEERVHRDKGREKPAAPVSADASAAASAAGESLKLEGLKIEAGDTFLQSVIEFFEKNSIEILERKMQKKTEYDFLIRIPSNVGTLEYFCTARKKASITDADLSAAYVRAQIKKLPILYLTSGKLTKKAGEILSKEFKNMTIKNINV